MSNEKKILIVIVGESFRNGPQGSRIRGGTDSFEKQTIASNSHVQFCKLLQNKFNFKVDVIINSYKFNEEWDNKITDLYNNLLIYKNFNDNLIGYDKLLIQSINIIKKMKRSSYGFIIFFRIDYYLKQYLFDNITLNPKKIVYAFIDPNTNFKNFLGVDPTLLVIPDIHFNYIHIAVGWHDSASNLIDVLSYENIGLIVNTPHLCSTDLEWNPLFTQVGRYETIDRPHKNKIYDLQKKIMINNYEKDYDKYVYEDTLKLKLLNYNVNNCL